MKIEQYLKEKKTLIEQALEKYLPPKEQSPSLIHQALHYSVFSGGKRLRPILVLAAAEAVDGDLEGLLPAACAIECIHTYSLIHDDLPAMDNDDFRRGKPTCHKVFGEGIAILAGDALLTYAFQLLSSVAMKLAGTELRVLQVIQEVSNACGTTGLIGGQVLDPQSENQIVDEDTLRFIHRKKTGALFAASVRTGALLAGANQEQLEDLTKYADYLGLAFQITDDILDIEGEASILGKPTGSDLRNRKATYPHLLGLDRSRSLVQECIEKALQSIASFDRKADPLRELVSYIGGRSN